MGYLPHRRSGGGGRRAAISVSAKYEVVVDVDVQGATRDDMDRQSIVSAHGRADRGKLLTRDHRVGAINHGDWRRSTYRGRLLY